MQLAPMIYASTRDGLRLPVIDVTDPRFAVPDDAESLSRLFALSTAEEQRNRRLPGFVMRFLLRRAAKQSLILRALFGGDASFVDGVTTYLMKLGAELPAPYDSSMDKRVATSPHLTLLRLRTQQVAKLLADALAPELANATSAPLHLVNIAGGPAIDSLNALILLRRRDADLLRRPIAIHVLDQDDAGPLFGGNALTALMQDGAPLNGLDITFRHRHYDWNTPTALDVLLGEMNASGAIIGASSEGGLFEYGVDDAIVANLTALRAHSVSAVVGSVTSADPSQRRRITASRFKLYPRGLQGFAPLAERGGWRIARSEPAQLSDQVLLVPA
ncbi:hypothetical protein MXD81_55685 [Microbacteriaceae bacterium K1510]|nr:hypothetical protein [Microbacteriaceae bacterium K1510]